MEKYQKKKRVSITIDKNILKELDDLVVDKSQLIQWLILNHLESNGIKIVEKNNNGWV